METNGAQLMLDFQLPFILSITKVQCEFGSAAAFSLFLLKLGLIQTNCPSCLCLRNFCIYMIDGNVKD